MFPFADDNYVLVVPSHLDYTGYSILVQDVRNGGMNMESDCSRQTGTVSGATAGGGRR